MMLLKHCTQYVSNLGKFNSGHRTGKGKLSFQSQRRAIPKKYSNYCTIALISHASKVMLKTLQARLQQYVNQELLDVHTVLEKAEEPGIKLPTYTGSQKKGISEKHLLLLQ